MRVLRWLAGLLATAILVVALLDTLGGRFLDGPLGPIPGGALRGPVSPASPADWSGVEKVVELEIRPSAPWSLHVWAVSLDGELYVPSAFGARRRWPPAALADPRVRMRTGGTIYERRIEKIEDPALRARLGAAFAARYDLDPVPPEEDATWYFRLAPR